MKYIGLDIPGIDSDFRIPVFRISPHELRIFHGLIVNALKHTPITTETQVIRNRMRTMQKQIEEFLQNKDHYNLAVKHEGIKKFKNDIPVPNPKGK